MKPSGKTQQEAAASSGQLNGGKASDSDSNDSVKLLTQESVSTHAATIAASTQGF